ncbi:MAG: class I SAM-dependent methyltransferase [Anaerolineaceae bacterium]|jgi:SAM-dependent methyltransferase|nr:MAG: class I SAM-dependent methyltransferase [Anaerolineaceae bacterium]
MREKEFDIQEVKAFYDSIGWQMTENGVYQNARYEDLRPVSREYIHKCHLRINRYLSHAGKYLLDAGSGPIQYPEYITYSQGYNYRVCLDLSYVALYDARQRIGSHGLFVVADVANMPFANGTFDDIVSLHTFHHLPLSGRKNAYHEVFRVLKPNANAVVVNGWNYSPFMKRMNWLMRIGEKLAKNAEKQGDKKTHEQTGQQDDSSKPSGTFVEKFDAKAFKQEILPEFNIRFRVWRSVSVRFLRTVIRPGWGGKFLLWMLYGLEELFPRHFGEQGQYPLIIMRKKEG